MKAESVKSISSQRVDRLVVVLVVVALIGLWGVVWAFTLIERDFALERARGQLESTVITLADFNQLAEQLGGGALESDARTEALWRALLQYPAASIWFESQGVVTAGEPVLDPEASIIVQESREDFSVYAALPIAEALVEWQRSLWQRLIALAGATLAFLLLTGFLAQALRERKAAEGVLREHDALLSSVAKGAAELLGSHNLEDAINAVLEQIGQTLDLSRVHLVSIWQAEDGHLHGSLVHEWHSAGLSGLVDDQRFQDLDLSSGDSRLREIYSRGELASFHAPELGPVHRELFESAGMRSFLQVPVFVEEKTWGALYFIDSSLQKREWSWAQTDTLKTLAGLVGVAMTRARYVQELSDANMIVQNSPTILYRLKGEPSFPLIYISHNIRKFGHQAQDILGTANWMQTLVEPEHQDLILKAMARMLESDGEGASIEFRLLTGDGGYRWVENRYTPVRDKNGRLVEVEGIIIDITERKAAEEKIATLARTDALTGLANRATFTERLRQAFAAARRGANPFAILYLDLDHFKTINDTLGHPIGDKLLKEVAERLRKCTRDTDLVARLGGDEYAVLQSDSLEPASAGILAQNIQSALNLPYYIDGNELRVTTSIGICPYSRDSSDPDSMLKQADLALYRSKEEGRNQYHFHSNDLDEEVMSRTRLAEDLRRAIDNGELELLYKPQVQLDGGEIVGMEALAVWNHPVQGLLKAKEFVPVAEKTGTIMALGRWMLNEACRQLHTWRKAGLTLPVVTLNLCPTQLKNSRELLSDVADTTAHWGLRPADLEFDVTEAMLAQTTWSQNDVLAQLRELGCRIAIDDFGTEYSSFDYLRAYSVHHLKIHSSILDKARQDPEWAAAVHAIVRLARDLKIGLTAEGMVREEQRDLLLSMGAARQSSYYAMPVDLDTASALLRKGILTSESTEAQLSDSSSREV